MGRFVRPEAIEGTTRVTRVFDQVHVVHRACRTVEADEGDLDEVRDRLRRLSRVVHPHLAKLVAVGEEGGRLMVVSEWLPGGQLARSHIPNPGRLLSGVAEALYALHRHGLAHGRITARSFVLDGNQAVKLVDACIHEGSVPEDIEAFGAAMEELYAGRAMPPELEQVARDAREGRFGDATLLAQAVSAVCASLPPVAVEPDDPPPAPPAPAPVADDDEDDERPLAFWLILALLPTVLLLWGALGAGYWLRAAPESPVARHVSSTGPVVDGASAADVTAEGHAPEAPPAPPAPPAEGEPPPAEAPAPASDATHAPAEPAPKVPLPQPYVEGGRVVVPPSAPEPAGTGAWRRTVSPGDQHPTTILVLDADNSVEDRVGHKGRPRLEVRCAGHRLSAVLHPGVSAVEVAPGDAVAARVTLTTPARGAEELLLRVPDPRAPVLVFPDPAQWVNRFAATASLDASYAPAASPPVTARFDTRGLPMLLGELRASCKL